MTLRRKALLTITIFLIGALTVIGINPEYEKVLEYKAYRIQYKQYMRGKRFFYEHRHPTNEELVDQAYMKLANKLLDDYLQGKDSKLIEEVMKLNRVHNLRYDTKRYLVKNVGVDSLIRNRDIFLDTTIWAIDVH